MSDQTENKDHWDGIYREDTFCVPFHEGKHTELPPPRAIKCVCVALRTKHNYWRRLVAHLQPSVGSLATELIVVLDKHNRPYALQRPGEVNTLHAVIVDDLAGKGFAARPSGRMAAAILEHIAETNRKTVHISTVISKDSRDKILVMRVALKPVNQLAINPSTQKVWFRTGHANVIILDTYLRTMIIIEPAGVELVKNLDRFLMIALLSDTVRASYRCYHNFGRPRPGSTYVDDDLCTVWCAVYAMVSLANTISCQDTFWKLVEWVSHNRPKLLRMFYEHVRSCMQGALPLMEV